MQLYWCGLLAELGLVLDGVGGSLRPLVGLEAFVGARPPELQGPPPQGLVSTSATESRIVWCGSLLAELGPTDYSHLGASLALIFGLILLPWLSCWCVGLLNVKWHEENPRQIKEAETPQPLSTPSRDGGPRLGRSQSPPVARSTTPRDHRVVPGTGGAHILLPRVVSGAPAASEGVRTSSFSNRARSARASSGGGYWITYTDGREVHYRGGTPGAIIGAALARGETVPSIGAERPPPHPTGHPNELFFQLTDSGSWSSSLGGGLLGGGSGGRLGGHDGRLPYLTKEDLQGVSSVAVRTAQVISNFRLRGEVPESVASAGSSVPVEPPRGQ